MKAILLKQSRYKKYETIALIKNTEEKCFIVALHYKEFENNSFSYAITPNENMFYYQDEQTEIKALKEAIEKYETIKI